VRRLGIGFPSAHKWAKHAIIPVYIDGVVPMRKMYLLIFAAALVACASNPAPKTSAVAQPATASTVAAAAPATPAAPEKAATGSTVAAGDGYIAPAGYQKKVRGTKTVYCKSDTPVGTRFAKEYCYTQQDLERMEASRSNTAQEVDRARRSCAGAGCGGG
jgi:hypothetical protein